MKEKSKFDGWISNSMVFIIIAIYRVCNAILIKTQFDPDEYWQTLEPAYCLVFSQPDELSSNCALTWEWTRMQTDEDDPIVHIRWIDEALYGPVRSHVPLLPTIILYKALKVFQCDTTWLVAQGPILLNALIVAAPVDFSVYYISKYISNRESSRGGNINTKKPNTFHRVETWSLLASLTNWFHGYALVRTYSNSMETTVLMVGMAMLCPELFGMIQDRTEYQVRPLALFAFLLGGLSVAIRFTALAAWIPLGFVISLRRKTFGSMLFYFISCALGGAFGVALGCFIDRYFYGNWVIPFFGSFHFNVLLGNGSLYGTHPALWYGVIGAPAIFGALTPFFLYETISVLRIEQKPKGKSILLLIIYTYIACHSISEHKEFRFILPILPLVCILAGVCLHSINTEEDCLPVSFMRRKTFLISLLILLNYPHLLFLCTIHQRSPIEANKFITNHLSRMISNQTNDELRSSIMVGKPTSIHYLMGCHSTPLYSHLHLKQTGSKRNRSLSIDARYLDCSPDCRSNHSIPCESDRFSSDPLEFIVTEYHLPSYESLTSCSQTDPGTCYNINNILPDFLAIFEEDLHRKKELETILINNGMIQLKKIPHAIKGVQFVHERNAIELNGKNTEETSSIFIGLWHIGLEICFEHMMIFSKMR